MKRLQVSLIVLVTLGLAYGVFEAHMKQRIETNLSRCEALKLGMTRQEVRALFGEPNRSHRRDQEGIDPLLLGADTWEYDVSTGYPDGVSCDFDSHRDAVIRVYCGQHIRVGLDYEFYPRVGYDSVEAVFASLLRLTQGMSAASVLALLGPPVEEIKDGDSAIWFYPREWLWVKQPIVVIDIDSKTVRSLDVGSEYFIVH